jgi:hypothetical protein
LSDAASELASSVVWSNLLDTIEADQYYHEQALFLDPYDVGTHLKLEHEQFAQPVHQQKSFLLQDHVAWSCLQPIVH